MSDQDLVLPIQNDQPEIVFVFGAGASYTDGVPIQSDILPIIVNDSDLQISKSDSGKKVRAFLKDNFSISGKFPTLEEVFGFLDFHINSGFSLSSKWSNSEMSNLKGHLAKLLHYVVSSKTRESKLFRSFWETISSNRKEIAVITTNYDTLIDDSFDRIYSDYLIDYCIDLINFRYPNDITPFDWWINASKPVTQHGIYRPIRTKLIKIHGSLNWKYCNCCGQVGLTPWQHRINLKTDSFESFHQSEITQCPFDGNNLSSLIQVPSHIKSNNNFIFSKLYDEAGYTLRNANKLIIVGYSFPEADVHIRAMVKRNLKENCEIVVINKSTAKDLVHRYETLSKNVKYNEMTFDNFLKSKVFQSILDKK